MGRAAKDIDERVRTQSSGIGAKSRVAGVLVSGAAAVLVAISARSSFPLPGAELPQTAQSLAVLLVGALLGVRRGILAIGLYILAGAVGLPVFADGASGLATALGPSVGYLLGFVLATAFLGSRADRGLLARDWWHALGSMVAAHGLILFLGGALLVPRVGLSVAWSGGVAPFLLGAAVKSAVAALAVVALARARRSGHEAALRRHRVESSRDVIR